MAKRPPKSRARTERRTEERRAVRVQEASERLFALEPGGSKERPIVAASAAVIEAHAVGVPCPRCGGSHELLEHRALVSGGVRLRVTSLRCRKCGSERSLWFEIVGASLN